MQTENELWNQTAGGSSYGEAKSIVSLSDGGWLAGGNSGPGVGGNKTSPGNGYSDYWLVRFDSAGGIPGTNLTGETPVNPCTASERIAGGGFFVSGQWYSPAGGNKTVPLLNSPDLWLLQLAPETPGDCDGDGVPDEQDLCSGTGGGAVDAHGCSIAQLCPCDGGWTNHEEYVTCVRPAQASSIMPDGLPRPSAIQLLLKRQPRAVRFRPFLRLA